MHRVGGLRLAWLRSRRLTEPPRPADVGNEPLRPLRGHLPFQGRLCSGSLQKAPSAEGAVSRRLTEDTPLSWHSYLLLFQAHSSTHPSPPFVEGGGPSAAAGDGRLARSEYITFAARFQFVHVVLYLVHVLVSVIEGKFSRRGCSLLLLGVY